MREKDACQQKIFNIRQYFAMLPASRFFTSSATYYYPITYSNISGLKPMKPIKVSVAPTQVGGAPTQVGMAPTQVGGAPTQVGIVPTQVGMAPTQVGIVPTQAGMAPTQGGITPTQVGMAPTLSGAAKTETGNKKNHKKINSNY